MEIFVYNEVIIAPFILKRNEKKMKVLHSGGNRQFLKWVWRSFPAKFTEKTFCRKNSWETAKSMI